MGRVYSDISKFRRVEASLREAVKAWHKAKLEIDQAMSGPRSRTELETLNRLRDECVRLHKEALDLLGELYERVDGKQGSS